MVVANSSKVTDNEEEVSNTKTDELSAVDASTKDDSADDGDDLFAASDVPVKKEKVSSSLTDFTGETASSSMKSEDLLEVNSDHQFITIDCSYVGLNNLFTSLCQRIHLAGTFKLLISNCLRHSNAMVRVMSSIELIPIGAFCILV